MELLRVTCPIGYHFSRFKRKVNLLDILTPEYYYLLVENNDTPTLSEKAEKSNSLRYSILIIILILLGFGIWYVLQGSKTNSNVTPAAVVTQTVQPTQASVFSSIQDALAKSVSLKCEYTDESDKKIVTYIKAGSIRTDFQSTDPKQSGSMIVKDKKMYFWNGKVGTMMAFDVEEMSKNITPSVKKSTTSAVSPNATDVISGLEKFKDSCKPAVVADSLFVAPTDVKFSDLSQMMKAIPTGAAMTEAQIKELQKQFGQ